MTPETQILALRLLLTAGLYFFLLLIVWVAWRELRASARIEAPAVAEPVAGEWVLVVVDGGGTSWQAGDSFPLQRVTALGRDMANTIVVPDPGASAEHALISIRDSHVWLEDLGSTNGTFFNGTRVSAPTIIGRGDIIRIGHVQFRLDQGKWKEKGGREPVTLVRARVSQSGQESRAKHSVANF
jgi:hypothetical protein